MSLNSSARTIAFSEMCTHFVPTPQYIIDYSEQQQLSIGLIKNRKIRQPCQLFEMSTFKRQKRIYKTSFTKKSYTSHRNEKTASLPPAPVGM